MKSKLALWSARCLFVLSISSMALAQEATPDEGYLPATIDKTSEVTQGWDQFLGSSLYGTFNQSKDVVGKSNGSTTTLGLKLEGALDYGQGHNEWRNRVDANTAYSRTPVLTDYLKSEDYLKLESIYLFHLPSVAWMGPYTLANLSTAMSPGYDQQPQIETYQIGRIDGSFETVETDRLAMTDPFRPLRLRESLGVFFLPLTRSWAKIELRTGAGFRQLLARDQLVINDDKDTPEIEVKELEDYHKAGLEFAVNIEGRTPNKRVSYRLSSDMLLPYAAGNETAKQKDQTVYEKRIIDADVKVSFHLVEWASIDYLMSAVRDPNILAVTQLSQTVMFSVNQILAPRARQL